MSAWMRKHFLLYDPDEAPTIFMPMIDHQKSYGVFNRWYAEMKKAMDGDFDWSTITEEQMRDLSEDMFDASGVPGDVRIEYWEWFERMKKALERNAPQ
jgi:hypothetical protein